MKERKRHFGDRYDGRRLRTLSPMSYVSPYIMKTRVTSSNYIRDKFDTEKAEEYDGLKMYLAQQYPQDRSAYTAGKAELVNRILAEAKVWRRG